MDSANFNVYTVPARHITYDGISIFFIVFIATWSLLLLCGAAFLIFHRDDPVVKIRGLPLSLTAICMLHLYWITGQLNWPVGRFLQPVLAYDVQYFFMGIFYPLGIALFQASNLQFLRVARRQARFASRRVSTEDDDDACTFTPKGPLQKCKSALQSVNILWWILGGMIIQTFLTIGMWVICRKYHPTFGIRGTEMPDETLHNQIVLLGRGWEWWPTLAWQLFWTWVVAPYLLFSSRHIRDTLGWRTQTIGCCLAGLHATPMFLITSHVDAFRPMNKYFVPSNWIQLSIMAFVVFTVFAPCIELIKHQKLRQQALDLYAEHESEERSRLKTQSSTIGQHKYYFDISPTNAEEGAAWSGTIDLDSTRLFTWEAFDHVLRTNPLVLQQYSALKDFSGENVAFLIAVAEWKQMWFEDLDMSQTRVYKKFNQALRIYTDFVSPKKAEFPVSLSSRQLDYLRNIFEEPAKILYGDTAQRGTNSYDGQPRHQNRDTRRDDDFEIMDTVQWTGQIGGNFNLAVFDVAAAQVKQAIYLNTWNKFIRELHEQRPKSSETERSEKSAESQRTLVERTRGYLTHVFA